MQGHFDLWGLCRNPVGSHMTWGLCRNPVGSHMTWSLKNDIWKRAGIWLLQPTCCATLFLVQSATPTQFAPLTVPPTIDEEEPSETVSTLPLSNITSTNTPMPVERASAI